MSDKNLKSRLQNTFLKFSIALSALSSVMPAKAGEFLKDDKQPTNITVSALPQQDTDIPTVNLSDSLSSNSDLAAMYLEQMKVPLSLESGRLDIIQNRADSAKVGDLKFPALYMPPVKYADNNQSHKLKQPKDLIKPSNIHFLDENDIRINKNALAVSNVNGHVYLKVFNNTDNVETQTTAQSRKNVEEYKAGNIVAMISTLLHEYVHVKHNLYDNMDNLTHPADIYRANRTTEKIAYAAQNLYAAQLYTILKDNGISTLEVNGRKIQAESILDFYPGLKDYVLQNGFSKNKKYIYAISKIATDYWNANRQNGYMIQNTIAAIMRYNTDNLFETIKSDQKQYDSTIDKMLKNVYIGNNTNVNLPRELFDDFSLEDAMSKLDNKNVAGDLTIHKIKELDTYLTGKNITSSAEKNDYLRQQFDNIVLRKGNQDEGLLNILLNTDSENKGTIIYADGLIEKRLPDKHTITGEYGEANINLHNHFTNLKNKVLGVSGQGKIEPIKQSATAKAIINKTIRSY